MAFAGVCSALAGGRRILVGRRYARLQNAGLSSFRGYPESCPAAYNQIPVTVAPTRRRSVIRIQQET